MLITSVSETVNCQIINHIFIVKLNLLPFTKQAQILGSQATLTSKKSLSHHTVSDLADDERSIEQDEAVKDCNGRLVPRLIVRAPTMVEVGERLES